MNSWFVFWVVIIGIVALSVFLKIQSNRRERDESEKRVKDSQDSHAEYRAQQDRSFLLERSTKVLIDAIEDSEIEKSAWEKIEGLNPTSYEWDSLYRSFNYEHRHGREKIKKKLMEKMIDR